MPAAHVLGSAYHTLAHVGEHKVYIPVIPHAEPAGHTVHSDAPQEPEKEPTAHALHADTPGWDEYFPGWQFPHEFEAFCEDFPAGHCEQAVAPVDDAYPAAHGTMV